jgi:putative ABC transport system substrate-binding protein
MNRRDFLNLLPGAGLAWSLPAVAQQKAIPVIGFLGSTSAEGFASRADEIIE